MNFREANDRMARFLAEQEEARIRRVVRDELGRIFASGTEARQRQDAEERLDPKGNGPTLEEGDAQMTLSRNPK